MRKNLKRESKVNNKPHKFIAEYSKSAFRHTNGVLTPTICLQKIMSGDGSLFIDHMWFNYNSNLRKIGELNPGDTVEFKASVRTYHKGHGYSKMDYKLSDPKSVKLLEDRFQVPLPMSKKLMIGYVLIKNHISLQSAKEDYAGEYMEWAKAEAVKIKNKILTE